MKIFFSKKLHIALAALALMAVMGSQNAWAQSLQTPSTLGDKLQIVAQNNTQLKALYRQMQANVLGNGANLRLPDPEAEVAYLFGSPKGVPNRTNVTLTQSLDWDVLLGRRKALAKANNQVAYANYRAEVSKVLTEVDQLLTNIVYYNKLCKELEQRNALAAELQSLYQKKYDRGDINQMELNKVSLNASVSRAEWARACSERQQLLVSLQALNGCQPMEFADTIYPMQDEALPPMAIFAEALDVTPTMLSAQAEVAQSEAEIKVAKAAAAPALTIGFQGEYIKQNNYSGLSIGFSLPIWGNTRRRVKQAEAELMAKKLSAEDLSLQLQSRLMQQYTTTVSLQRTANELQSDIARLNNDRLLRRSLELGQTSLLDYLLELSFYYTARTAQLEAERDAQLALSALRGLTY